MTEKYFFDTDYLSAFLWVKEESLLSKLYTRIIIPKSVYLELSKPNISHLKARIDFMVESGHVIIEEINLDTEEFEIYRSLALSSINAAKLIGKGEASCIAMAKVRGGIIASNNLRDIRPYIEKYKLVYTTTADILVDAHQKGLISESEGNRIWIAMLNKRRKIGADTFTQYLNSKRF